LPEQAFARGLTMGKILWSKLGKLNEFTKLIIYFGLGAVAPILFVRVAQAAGSSPASTVATNRGLAPYAIAAVVIGIIFLILYIRAIYLVLTYAAKTYDIEIDSSSPSKYGESTANKIITFGSALLVVGSATIISSYGWGPWFLFIGPTMCLFCSTVILVSMEVDIKKYKEILKAKHRDKQLSFAQDD
jgi:hypothetical protein